jgi:hypothetical protein
MTTIDDSTAVGLGMLTFVLIVVLYVWTALALSAVFRKSGEQPWKAWVPILNQVVLLQLGGFSGWLFLLVLVPFVGPVIVWALLIVACYRINVAFGHGVGMTVLAALVLPVWASVLGFGPARWLGTELGARGAQGAGPRRTAAVDPGEPGEYVPRATPPAYSPSLPLPAPPPGDWNPPPVPPLPTAPEPASAWGGFDLGAVSEVTSEVTGADSSAPAPISAVPVRAAAPEPLVSEPPAPVAAAPEPPSPVAAAPPVAPAPVAAPPVTRVPAMPAPEPAAEPWAPQRSPMAETDAFTETSGQVSAIVGAPAAGTPRSARASVSSQHTKAHIPDDPLDETIITRRRRAAWSLVPPAGAAIPLTADVVLVGRKPSPDRGFPGAQLVSIDDGTVSKTHARLTLRDDHWYVTDLGSTNGVLFATLMGTEVEAAPGEEVEAGERFFLGDAEVRLQRSDG